MQSVVEMSSENPARRTDAGDGTGLYDAITGARVHATRADGTRDPDDAVTLAVFEVRP